MSGNLLLALDIGTSGCKMAVFNLKGEVIATYLGEYKTYYPETGFAEHDTGDWWDAICEGLQYFKKEEKIEVSEIAAVGVDGLSWAAIPVNKEGEALRKAMIWLDRRAEKQAQWMKKEVGEEKLIQLNGNPVDPAYLTPKILWIKENEPELYQNTYKFLQSNSFIVNKLTGKFSQDYSQGYSLHFFDIKNGQWDKNMAAALGISLDLVAPLYHSQEIVGEVTATAAAETGLEEGTPVAAGGLDAACCTLGAGVIEPGLTQEQGGQAGGMSIQLDNPVIHPQLIMGYHVIPDQWLLQGGTVGGGGTLRWFKEELGTYEKQQAAQEDLSSYAIMDQEAKKIPPGSEGLIFLPYMAGERSPIWNSKARGVFFGLAYDKTRAHMIRAMMEGVGFSLLHNLRTAEEVDAEVKELNSVGGASQSQFWTQMKADITGKKFNVPYSNHATTLGAAILAGIGTGIYDGFADAVEKTIDIERTHSPDLKNHEIYKGYYHLYLELYNQIKDCYDELHRLASKSK